MEENNQIAMGAALALFPGYKLITRNDTQAMKLRAEIRAITALSEDEIEQRTKGYSVWALQGVIDRAKEGNPVPW